MSHAEIAPRVYTPVRVEDGPTVRARLVRWPALSPDGKRIVFSAMNRLYVMELPDGTPRLLTSAPAGSSAAEGEFMPTWSPDGRFIAYVTWTTTGGHIKRVPAGGGAAETLSRFEGYYLDPVYTPDGSKLVYLAGAAADQLYAIMMNIQPEDERAEEDVPGEIGGINPPNTLEIRWMPSGGGAPTLVASAQGGRAPHFARNDSSRIYLTSGRGLQSIDISGLDRRTLFRIQGSGPGNNPPSADEIRLSPDGSRAFVNLQGKHFLVPVPRAGRETVDIKIQGRADGTPVPVKRMSLEGGDYLRWSSDGATMTWALGAQFFRQTLDAAEPQKTTVVVELPRARPSGSVLLSGARVITMKGDEVMARGDVLVTGNRIAAIGAHGSLRPPAGTRTIDVQGKTIMPGLVDAHSHMWPPRGLHQTEIWQYMSNLAYGVTTTRDPQTSTPDVFAYADMVDVGMVPGPRIYATGPGVFSSSGIEDRDAAFKYIKRYKEAYHTNTLKQYVAGDRLVRQWIIEACKEYRHHGDDRRFAGSQAEPDADGRRLLRPGAQLSDHAALQGRRGVRRAHEDVLHADDPGRVRRAVDGELLVREREPGQGSEAAAVDSDGAARHDDAPSRAVVPPRRGTATPSSANRWPTSSTPAAARGSAATVRCRGSGRIGKPGTSARAG